jgi:hypothetical protein
LWAAFDSVSLFQVLPAAPYLITFILPGPSVALQEQACWVLGNVAADGPELRSALMANGALPPLVRILRDAVKVGESPY